MDLSEPRVRMELMDSPAPVDPPETGALLGSKDPLE